MTFPAVGAGNQNPGFLDERREHAYLPLTIALAYVCGTYLLFLTSPLAETAPSVGLTTLFIGGVALAFAVGYIVGVKVPDSRAYSEVGVGVGVGVGARRATKGIRVLILASALWFILFGVASLYEYGATGLGDILQSIQNPSQGYFDKFAVVEEQQATGRVNVFLQVAVLTGGLYFALVPLLVVYWKNVGRAFRILGVASIGVYLAYFLFIGTQKGVGDLLAFVIASALVVVGTKTRARGNGRFTNRRAVRGLVAFVILLALLFFVFLANIQGDRIYGKSVAAQYQTSAVISELFGEKFALGVAITIYYPTHGYEGLAQQLELPFVFSGGASVPALADYKVQYLGGTDPMTLSYPVRNEAITGRPAGQVWSTVFPWLASDLTFMGVIAFAGVFGGIFARTWLVARRTLDPLAIIMFSVLLLAVMYIPANNQVMLSRYTALGFLQLCLVYVLRGVHRALGKK